MSPVRLSELFPGAPGDILVTGLTADSRRVRPGYVFAALKGSVADGRAFAAQAVENGAVALLTHAEADPRVDEAGLPVIRSDDPRLALAHAAARLFPLQPDTVAAVTGTNGKSSTVDFLRQIWTACGHRAASMGTLGAIGPGGAISVGHTTPDPVTIHETLQRLAADGVTHLAMEASSHGLDQRRSDAVRLAAVGFLNLTQDHLDYHGDMDAYRDAKLRLFRELAPRGAPAAINADSPDKAAFEAAAIAQGLEILSFGWRAHDLKLIELTPRLTSQDLWLSWRGREAKVRLPLIGEFQALNALAAAALALGLGEKPEAVFAALTTLKGVRGRLDLVGQTPDGAAIFVDYAHTPDGLDTLLRAARPHAAGRLHVVFGCGGDRDRTKRPLMGAAAVRLADRVIVTDDNPRSEDPESIRKAILAGAPGAIEIADRAEAIRAAIAGLKPGDALLIAGKGHETGQIIGAETRPFSDHEEAANGLRRLGGGHD